MSRFRHVFACLVHDRLDCVINLVRNLRCLDDDSEVVLFNGGPHHCLLDAPFPFADYGARVLELSRPLAWGRLEPFAFAVCREVLRGGPIDAITFVDSDQLLLRPGYVDALRDGLARAPRAGLLSSDPRQFDASTDIGPVRAAWNESSLWSSLVESLGGSGGLFHWSFWPGTVFSGAFAAHCADMVSRASVEDFLQRTNTWALEEVLFPTLAAALGFTVEPSVCRSPVNRFRVEFATSEVDAAWAYADAFWLHPVARDYGHPLRAHVRDRHRHYRRPAQISSPFAATRIDSTTAILAAVEPVEGWLTMAESRLLVAAVAQAATFSAEPLRIVEVGSFCGRSTTALALALRETRQGGRVHAIDPHDGQVGSLDTSVEQVTSSADRMLRVLAANGAAPFVEPVRQRSLDVDWSEPIDLLFVDALHDYVHVALDFCHFERWLRPRALVAFHDYAEYYPGVQAFVDELIAARGYECVERADSLVLLQRRSTESARAPAIRSAEPLVTCIMPTGDRPHLVAQSIDAFLAQTYARSELLIVDDGRVPLSQLPSHARVRYLRLDQRMVLGDKRNLACGWARGELIAHWDDDDWYAPWRLAYQVDALRRAPEATVCGVSSLRFLDLEGRRAWRYRYPPDAGAWAAGATLCYRADHWRGHPFPSWACGEDHAFTSTLPPGELLLLDNDRFIVATVHSGNTSPRDVAGPWWEPLLPAEVEAMLADSHALAPPGATATTNR